MNSIEGGNINQGFELSNKNNENPEGRVERNLRHDLEAQKRHRENVQPITRNLSQGDEVTLTHGSSPVESVQPQEVPLSEIPGLTKTFIEVRQEPNGVNKTLLNL